jgi:RNA polymerase sigma-70 factor (ECF subfamily)
LELVGTSGDQLIESEGTPELTATFRRLFEAEFTYVCRSLRRLGVREADMKDVAQEIFLAVHRHLDEYDTSRPVRPWLFSFSLRFAANYRRLARNRAHLPDDGLHQEAAPGSDVEARDLVLRALEALDFDFRVVFVMHDLEGFSAPEIAEQTGSKLNTVYSRIRLAREAFKSAVERLQTKGAVP